MYRSAERSGRYQADGEETKRNRQAVPPGHSRPGIGTVEKTSGRSPAEKRPGFYAAMSKRIRRRPVAPSLPYEIGENDFFLFRHGNARFFTRFFQFQEPGHIAGEDS